MQIEIALPIEEEECADKILEKKEIAACMHLGSHENISLAYAALFTWLNKNGYLDKGNRLMEIWHGNPLYVAETRLVTEIVMFL